MKSLRAAESELWDVCGLKWEFSLLSWWCVISPPRLTQRLVYMVLCEQNYTTLTTSLSGQGRAVLHIYTEHFFICQWENRIYNSLCSCPKKKHSGLFFLSASEIVDMCVMRTCMPYSQPSSPECPLVLMVCFWCGLWIANAPRAWLNLRTERWPRSEALTNAWGGMLVRFHVADTPCSDFQ